MGQKYISGGDKWAVVDATDYEHLSQHKWSKMTKDTLTVRKKAKTVSTELS